MQVRTIYPSLSEEVFMLPIYVTGVSAQYLGEYVNRQDEYIYHLAVVCTGGEGELIYNGTPVTIRKNDGFFFHRHIPQYYRPISDEWHLQWVTFCGSAADNILAYLGYKDFELFKYDDRSINGMFAQIYTSVLHNNPFTASTMLCDLLHSIKKSAQLQENLERFSDVIAFIQTNYATDISLPQLAELLNVSTHYLCRVFKASYHISPMQYVTLYRLSVAKQMLIETSLSVESIARAVGFQQTQYFFNVFRRYECYTPTKFRNLFRPVSP